jgi:hypothetical protein
MLENTTVTAEPCKKPQVSAAKSLVYLSVSFAKKPIHSKSTQYVKITSRLLSQSDK